MNRSLLARIYETGLTPEQVAAHVRDDGLWRGPTTAEWVARIAAASTPIREYEVIDGVRHFRSWINPERRSS